MQWKLFISRRDLGRVLASTLIEEIKARRYPSLESDARELLLNSLGESLVAVTQSTTGIASVNLNPKSGQTAAKSALGLFWDALATSLPQTGLADDVLRMETLALIKAVNLAWSRHDFDAADVTAMWLSDGRKGVPGAMRSLPDNALEQLAQKTMTRHFPNL
jgi:hypothetical protein